VRREKACPGGPSPRVRGGPRSLRDAGFSLIEMLTTMSILGVMLVVASPGLASLTSANAVSAVQNELASALMLARSEALKRGTQVAIAGTASAPGDELSGGWTIFVDANGNGVFDEGETLVRQQPASHGDVHVKTDSGATSIAFNSRGFLATSAMVTLTVCSSRATKSYQIRLEPVGLADIAETTGCS
jgi:type IV fimbrial biogenesis protein FimT